VSVLFALFKIDKWSLVDGCGYKKKSLHGGGGEEEKPKNTFDKV